MVVVSRPAEWVEEGEIFFYIDDHLAGELEKIKKKVNENDEDYFVALDGAEGGGKSVLALQICRYVDPTFTIDRVTFTAQDFQSAILNAKKGEAVLFDEAFRGLSSRGALSDVNKLLVGLMMECRQKNLFVVVVMPSFFLLDKYVALFRAKGLFHVYRPKAGEHKGKRGFWMFFNTERKKQLYMTGRKNYDYRFPESNFKGRFYNQYSIEEQSYRDKKAAALQSTSRITKAETYMDQRNLLLWFLNREARISTTEISNRLKDLGWEIAQNSVSEAIVKKEADLKNKGYLL